MALDFLGSISSFILLLGSLAWLELGLRVAVLFLDACGDLVINAGVDALDDIAEFSSEYIDDLEFDPSDLELAT